MKLSIAPLLLIAVLASASCKSDAAQKVHLEHGAIAATKKEIPAQVANPSEEIAPESIPANPEKKKSRRSIYIQPPDTAVFQSLPGVKIEAHMDVLIRKEVLPSILHARPWYAEVMPEFKGGKDALDAFIRKHLRYPRRERKAGIEATVYASFTIDEKGKVSNPEVVPSFEGEENFEKEAIKLIRKMPDWIPASDGGKNVPVQYEIAIKFKL